MLDAIHRLGTATETYCTPEQYETLYRRSVEDSDGFWLEQAGRLDWIASPSKGGEWSFDPVHIAWFADGTLNLCHNAVDRHLPKLSDVPALIFEPDDPHGEGRVLLPVDAAGQHVREPRRRGVPVRRGVRDGGSMMPHFWTRGSPRPQGTLFGGRR